MSSWILVLKILLEYLRKILHYFHPGFLQDFLQQIGFKISNRDAPRFLIEFLGFNLNSESWVLEELSSRDFAESSLRGSSILFLHGVLKTLWRMRGFVSEFISRNAEKNYIRNPAKMSGGTLTQTSNAICAEYHKKLHEKTQNKKLEKFQEILYGKFVKIKEIWRNPKRNPWNNPKKT